MIRNRLTILLGIFCFSLLALGHTDVAQADRAIRSTASGTGAYIPTSLTTGFYFGPGTETNLGNLIFNGNLQLEEIKPGKFRFENAGRGTEDENFHEAIYEDGSSISTRYRGIVELTPVLDGDGNPTGQFTGLWKGNWKIVRGTGRFRGAKGGFRITAINDPFYLTDPVWNFSWTWTGNLTVPSRPDICDVHRLETVGTGVFDPANLGLGDPLVFPFPVIIGDGSGEGIYDGTPTGMFSLDGALVGPDQHFGTAQSFTPGILSPAGTIWYPGVSGANPDGSGREIHIMHTDLGEIWFENKYYFELDAVMIVGRADFRVVGGTQMFEDATGSVYVRVESLLSEVTGLPDMPVAPFTYDFKGFIELCDGK